MARLCCLFTMMIAVAPFGRAATDDAVGYPAGYRSWQHVKTGIIQPDHPLSTRFGGIHHVYANESALIGLTTGEYLTGASFVFDLLSYSEIDSTISEGDRLRIDVMQFDPERFTATGGWGFDSFVRDSPTRVDQNTVEACFSCHTSAAASNHVFSSYRP